MKGWKRRLASFLCMCMVLNLTAPAYGASLDVPMTGSGTSKQTPSDTSTDSDADMDDEWYGDEDLEDDVNIASDSDLELDLEEELPEELPEELETEALTYEFEWGNLVDGFPMLELSGDAASEELAEALSAAGISAYSMGVDGFYGEQLDSEAEAYYQLLTDYYDELMEGIDPVATNELNYFPFDDVEDMEALNALEATVFEREKFYIWQAIAAFRYDYPEMFWDMNISAGAYTGYSVNQNTGMYTGQVTVYISIENKLYNDAVTAFELCAMADDMQLAMDSIDVPDGTDYEVLRAIHDALCEMADYDHTLSSPFSHSAYGILVEGTAVCEGYAKAFKVMCDAEGIPCVLVVGQGGSADQDYEAHMWNYVQLEDGNWYAVDVTWDDQSMICYDFFLTGSETIAENFGGESFGDMHQEETIRIGSELDAYFMEFDYPILAREAYDSSENDVVVYIPDEALKQALLSYDRNGDGDLTKNELAAITTLYIGGLGVKELTGLEAAVNLENLNANVNDIIDLTPISGLSKLSELHVAGNQIGDLTPVAGLSGLSELYVDGNQIADLTPISGLSQLSYLDVSDNQIMDLSPIAGLTELEGLWAANNSLTEIPNLNRLTKLRLCDQYEMNGVMVSDPREMFVGNKIPRENLKAGLSENQDLSDEWLVVNSYDDTPVEIPDQALKQILLSQYDQDGDGNLTQSEMMVVGWIYAYNEGISDLTGLEVAVNLRELYLNNNQITDLTPIAGLTRLTNLEVNGNLLTEIPDLSALTRLVLEEETWNGSEYVTEPKRMFEGNKIPKEGFAGKFADNVTLTEEWLELNAYDAASIEFRDVVLFEALKEEYDTDQDGVLTASELKNIEGIYLENRGITDLTGLEHAVNLRDLYLDDNQITDLTPISGLTKLRYLSVQGNLLTDIPDLSGMDSLEMYYSYDNSPRNMFGGNQITRDKFEGKLPKAATEEWLKLNSYDSELVTIPDTALKAALVAEYDSDGDGELCKSEMLRIVELEIQGLGIQSLEGLQYAENLLYLEASDNHLKDIEVLSGCTKLGQLYLNHNELTDIDVVSGLTNLWELYVNDNQLSEVPDLTSLTDLNLYLSTQSGTVSRCMFAGNKALTSRDQFDGKFVKELTDDWILVNTYNSDEVSIPDANLKAALFEQGCDLDGDGVITIAELSTVTSLDLSGRGIKSLSGLEYAYSLVTLDVSDNQITSLSRLKTCTSLVNLWARNNQLTSLPDFFNFGIWLNLYDESTEEQAPRDMFSGNELTCSKLENIFWHYSEIDDWLEINACDWGVLTVPVLEQATAMEDGSIQIFWNKQSLAEGYEIYRRTESTGWSQIATLNDLSAGSWYSDEHTVGGITYYYTVAAFRTVDGEVERTGYDEDGVSATALKNGTGEVAVYFNSMGGTSVSDQLVSMGEAAREPAVPSRTGYSFEGWYKDQDYLEKYSFDEPVYEDMTLYAKWQEILDIANADIEITGTYTYTGQEITPALVVKVGTAVLEEGTDYTVTASAENIHAGENTGKLLITGIGSYSGTKEAEFTILKAQMDHSVPDQELSASYGTILSTLTLTEPWKWDKEENTVGNVGTQTHGIVYPGDDDHEDQYETISVTVTPRSIDSAMITLEYDTIEYDASAKEPQVLHVDADGVEVPSSEYVVSYTDNENAGTASVTVTISENGSGNFTGSAEAAFEITRATTPDPVIVNKVYDVVYGDPLSSAELPEGWSWQDGTQDVGNVTGVNKTFKADYKATENSNYGDVSGVDLKVRVVPRELTSGDVHLTENAFIYDGTEKEPAVEVTSAGKLLEEGADKDYTVAYQNNIAVGTAEAVVTGVNNYQGTVTAAFQIIADPHDVVNAVIVLNPSEADYTGEPIEPEVSVELLGQVLTEDTDYSVEYADNINPGYGKVIITGMDPYHGEKTVAFRIYSTGYELSATYGDKLNDVRLPGDWEWKEPDTYVGDATAEGETNSFTAVLSVDGEALEEVFEISVAPKDIELTDITIHGDDVVYVPGVPATPEIVIRDLALIDVKDPLTEQEDYTAEYSNNIYAGAAGITITGIGNYTGTVERDFVIQKAESVPVAESDKIDENKEIHLTIKEEPFFLYAGFVGDGTLSFSSDDETVFTITKKINPVTGVEDGELAVTGIGEAVLTLQVSAGENYKASEPVKYKVIVTKVPISGANIKLEADSYEYDGGNQIRPEVEVTVDGVLLEEGSDYTVSYGENRNAGTGTVTITGINDYEGTATVEFEIAKIENPAELPDAVEAVYGQTLRELALSGDWSWKNPDSLVGNVGTRAFDVVLEETQNYLEKTGTVTVTVSEKTLDAAMVELEYVTTEYDGTEKTPKVTVNDGKLATAEDYTVTYTDNLLPGTASVTVTAQNNYTGVVTKSFTITKGKILDSHVTVAGSFVYDGASHNPEPEVKINGRVLMKDVDYVIASYGENIHAGIGTVTVSGIGNYTGTAEASFTISKAESLATPPNAVEAVYGQLLSTIPLENGWAWENPDDSVGNAGVNEIPAFLAETQDYNKKTAMVTVTVEPKKLSDDMVVLDDAELVYDGSSKQPTVSVLDGTALGAADYQIEYENNVHAGTAAVIVTGIGNYQGTVKKSFVIEKASPVIHIGAGTEITRYQTAGGFALNAVISNAGVLTYTSSDTAVATVDEAGNVTPVAAGRAVITVSYAGDADHNRAQVQVQLTIQRRSSGSGSSSGGSSSGSSSSVKTSVPAGYTGPTRIIDQVEVPSYVEQGAWFRTAEGGWSCSNSTGGLYSSGWYSLYNPYANLVHGQMAFDWFLFDESGNMRTGWYTDEEGDSYYLNPVSDNTQGRMVTGWWMIDGVYYYFNEVSDGKRGRLLKNAMTPDGFWVDEKGAWLK